jgi:hypothetical protein
VVQTGFGGVRLKRLTFFTYAYIANPDSDSCQNRIKEATIDMETGESKVSYRKDTSYECNGPK